MGFGEGGGGPLPPPQLFYPNPLTGFILPVGEQGDLAGLV